MHIDELLAQVNAGSPDLIIPKTWTQGRTAFGGLSAALVYQAMRREVDSERVLRSLTINFIGPLTPDTPYEITTELLREGKNALQMTARAIQNGKVAVMAVAVFGAARTSKIAVDACYNHQMTLPKKPKFIPQIPKVTPKFLRYVDLAIEDGQMPFTGSKKSHHHGWMRFSDAPQAITDAHLIALADAWPPAPLQMLRWPAPASSISWNLEFVHPHRPIAPDDWIAFQASTVQAADGYAHTEGHLWDPQGELIALSRQVVGIFD